MIYTNLAFSNLFTSVFSSTQDREHFKSKPSQSRGLLVNTENQVKTNRLLYKYKVDQFKLDSKNIRALKKNIQKVRFFFATEEIEMTTIFLR